MQQLSNNCRVGKFSVYPKIWQSKNATTKNYWFISYYFYDDNLLLKKQIRIRGMNKYMNLVERRSCTSLLIDDELHALQIGYNPITGKFYSEPEEKKFYRKSKNKVLRGFKKSSSISQFRRRYKR